MKKIEIERERERASEREREREIATSILLFIERERNVARGREGEREIDREREIATLILLFIQESLSQSTMTCHQQLRTIVPNKLSLLLSLSISCSTSEAGANKPFFAEIPYFLLYCVCFR